MSQATAYNPSSPARQVMAATALDRNGSLKEKGFIYVSDIMADVVSIYPLHGHNQKRIGQIAGLRDPLGMTVDKKGNLYIADGYDILIYSAGSSPTLKSTLVEGGYGPHDVAVDEKNGDVAVANEGYFSSGGGGISFYHRGVTTPYKTVTDPSFPNLLYDGFDDSGNLYLDGFTGVAGVPVFGEISAGGKSIKSIRVSIGAGSGIYPGTITIDEKNDMIILSPQLNTIYCFEKDPPYDPCGQMKLLAYDYPETFALLQNEHRVYTGDLVYTADEYRFFAGGYPVNTIQVGGKEPFGIAVAPAAQP
jgi:DNA-binding beta-propeller fold protein YncE